MNLYISQSVLMDHGKFLASGSTKHFLSPYEIEDVIFETLKNNPSKLLYCIPSNKRSLLSESLTKARTACLQDELGSMHKKLNTVELQAFLMLRESVSKSLLCMGSLMEHGAMHKMLLSKQNFLFVSMELLSKTFSY